MNALETGLQSALLAGTALTALLAGTASVYGYTVPLGDDYPLVVFKQNGGDEANQNSHRFSTYEYQVKAISKTSMLQAGNIDAQIEALLHGGALTVSGWVAVWCMKIQPVRYSEVTPEGQYYYHSGGIYQIKLSK